MNIFEIATRQALRFGSLSTEQLWSANYSTLENLEKELTDTVESYGKSTRRSAKSKTVEQERNVLRLAIVTHILDVRDEEAKNSQEAASKKAHNEAIARLIAEKEDAELRGKSIDELKAMLK